MKSMGMMRCVGAAMVAMLAAGCTCPSSYREVPLPVVRSAADVPAVTRCQMQHYGATLLGLADSAATVRTLLEHGADLRGKLVVGGKVVAGTPLNLAQTPDVVRALAAAGCNPNTQGGKNNTTPLCEAIRRSCRNSAAALLAAGADPNLADAHNDPPLVIAARMGDAGLCELLLSCGARANDSSRDDGASPLLAALRIGKIETRTDAKLAIVSMLLAAGANPLQADSGGTLPLHLAPSCLIPTLLAAGADINCRNGKGRTPLFFGGSQQRLELLLRNGADPNARDFSGNSAFDIVPEAGLKSYLLIRGCRSGKAL